jgi:poly(A) polymerase
MRLEADWLRRPALRAVVEALGGRCWFVGGCVRNTLLGQPVTDIDLATPLRPEEVVRRLEAAGLKAVPTGIEHGTVTAVSQGTGYEITTFRADVETDGRRAKVRFSADLAEDARRRDFTMNALYAAPDGTITDPVGGLPDLRARRVRFIGDPHDRIREDYLRILRFFRFTAWYGADIDADGLAACAELADGVEGLARERIGHEMRKLLAAPDPAPAVASMAAAGVLLRCLPGADPALLAPLVHLEQGAGAAPDWLARLAALGGEDPEGRLRLSRAEAKELETIRRLVAAPVPVAVAAHDHGPRAARAMALLVAAAGGPRPPGDLEAEIARGAAASFPLTGADLVAAGLKPGPGLGAALGRARRRWIASGFSLDKSALLDEALRRGAKD